MKRSRKLPEHMQLLVDAAQGKPGTKPVAPLHPIKAGECIYFTVPGEPRPWQRARVDPETNAHYTAQKVRDAMKDFVANAVVKKPANWPMHAAYSIDICCYFEANKPADVDNLMKLPCDAFNTVLWDDDRQVLDGRSRKFLYSPLPRTEVRVTVLGEMPSKKAGAR